VDRQADPGPRTSGGSGSKLGLVLFDGNLAEVGKGCQGTAAKELRIGWTG